MFSEGLDEFDHACETCQSLIDEYKLVNAQTISDFYVLLQTLMLLLIQVVVQRIMLYD